MENSGVLETYFVYVLHVEPGKHKLLAMNFKPDRRCVRAREP